MITMARRATREISAEEDRSALHLLAGALAHLHGSGRLRAFLAHALTKAERVSLVRRLGVARRLAAGQSYRMIQGALRVSPNLIQRVDRWLRTEDPRYRRLFPLRQRRRRARARHPRVERDGDPGSLDQFFKRFPLWGSL